MYIKPILKPLLSAVLVAVTTFGAASEPPAKGISSEQLDSLTERAMETFKVPGIAVGIVKDGEIVHAKGYGVREVGRDGAITPDTLFSIASVSKAFTAAALALLVDEKKIDWDDKVTNYIPAFELYDPWVTREFTIRDLLIHNSGLGLGAGDLMFWPSSAFSRQEMIENLKHLKPVSSFRSEYAYDNLLYIVAGEIIPAVTGQSYEDFVDQNILKPLGMQHCAANRGRLETQENIAEPHVVVEGQLQKAARLQAIHEEALIAAAGGLQCSVSSLLKWLDMHLNEGLLPSGDRLLSALQQQELMSPQTITPVDDLDHQWFNTNFSSYGLGWQLQDVNGYKWVSHTGGLLGVVSYVSMIPDLDLGVVVLTNQQSGAAMASIMYSIVSAYTAGAQTDWIARLDALVQEGQQEAAASLPNIGNSYFKPNTPLTHYSGSYQDPWFGRISITEKSEGLYLKSDKSERLKGVLIPHKPDLFIVRWDDRTLEADAYVKFSRGFDGKPDAITMRAISPLTDFSFDFHDLNFERLPK